MDAIEYCKHGDLCSKKGEYDSAIEYYSKALAVDPKSAQAYSGRGHAYSDKTEYDKAIEDYSRAIEIDSKQALVYGSRGAAYFVKGEDGKAIEDYSKAINIAPQDYEFYHLRGIAHLKIGKYGKAIEDCSRAAAIAPQDAEILHNRANAYCKSGAYNKAIEDYSTAIKIAPEYAAAYYNRGIVYQEKGECDKASADYSKAIKIDPQFTDACRKLEAMHPVTNGDEPANTVNSLVVETEAAEMIKTELDNKIAKLTLTAVLLNKGIIPILGIWLWIKCGFLATIFYLFAGFVAYKLVGWLIAGGLALSMGMMTNVEQYFKARVCFLSLSLFYGLWLLLLPWGLAYAIQENFGPKNIPACDQVYSNKGDRESISLLMADYRSTVPMVRSNGNVMLLSAGIRNAQAGNYVAVEAWVCRAQKLYGRPSPTK